MPEDLALAWLKEVRDLNAEAEAAEARVLEYDRTHDAFHHLLPRPARQRPRASRLISRRAMVASQPRDARGRWLPMGRRWTHGTNSSYAWAKCRCRECVAAWNARCAAIMRARYVPKRGRAA